MLVVRILNSYSNERQPIDKDVITNVLAQIALMAGTEPYDVALRSVMEEGLKFPNMNQLWAQRMTGFGEPRSAYLTEDQGEHKLVGTRLTHLRLVEGNDLQHAVSLDRFALLLREDCESQRYVRVRDEASRWQSQLNVLTCQTESLDARWDNVVAVLVRPDLRVVWAGQTTVMDGDLSMSLRAVLRRWFE